MAEVLTINFTDFNRLLMNYQSTQMAITDRNEQKLEQQKQSIEAIHQIISVSASPSLSSNEDRNSLSRTGGISTFKPGSP